MVPQRMTRILTVPCNGRSLEDLESIRAFKCRNLSMGELRKELRFSVVLVVDVLLRQGDLEASKSCSRADLCFFMFNSVLSTNSKT